VSGPLILIALGALFLMHTLSPDFRVAQFISAYWPYFLILWGVIQLLELAVVAMQPKTLPPPTVGAGSWFVIVLLCIAGSAAHEIESPNNWWERFGFPGDMSFLGSEHDFSIAPIERAAGDAPHIVIESFRGDAKVTAGDGPNITVTGHKVVHAFDDKSAVREDAETPVDVVLQGKTVVVRCNQNRAAHHESIATNLEISVPRGSSLEATGTSGDFDVSGLAGDVDITSSHADLRVNKVKGNLHVDIARSGDIRCDSIAGAVTLRGHGSDVALTDVSGEVDVNGDFSGLISLAHIAKHVRLASMRSEFDAVAVPGEVKLARGSLDGNGLTGPTKVAVRATDVSLTDYSDSLDLSVDKGDVDLRPVHLPLSNMSVHDGAGDIDLALPATTGLELAADTGRGSIQNDLGFAPQSDGRRAHLEGAIGKGAQLNLSTRRGDINIHRANGVAKPASQIAQSKSDDDDDQ
jgi:DUF4097 and DUF4098 domain-containing protein YvlB